MLLQILTQTMLQIMKKILISVAFIIILSGILLVYHHAHTNRAPSSDAPDVNGEVKNHLAKILDSDNLTLWYEYEEAPEDSPAPQFEISADERIMFQYVFENSTWEKASASDMPKGSSVNFGSKDDKHFLFWSGETVVAYLDDNGLAFYRAQYRAPDDAGGSVSPLSEKIFEEFSSLESNAAIHVKVKNSGQGHLDVAYQYIIRGINALYGMTEENHQSIKDYQVLNLHITEDADDKFVFCEEKAVKPRYPHTNAYLAGNGYEGDGEWSEYRISTSLYKLELRNGYWVCTNIGSGDIHLGN